MVMISFSVFDWKYAFLANLVQKVTIISWSWNLVHRLIRICWIQWCCSFFSFWLETLFLGKFGSNCRYLQGFLFPIRNALFWENLVQNVKIVSLRLNLLASLIRICRIQRQCSLFCFWWENTFFLAIVVQNVKIVSLKLNFSS